MRELRDCMTFVRRSDRESNLLSYLVLPSCLIIDEAGHCEFDEENTRLFFDMANRRYQRESFSNMALTSNRDPAQWKANFCENDALLCVRPGGLATPWIGDFRLTKIGVFLLTRSG